MSEDSFALYVNGPAAVELARRVFPCCPPVPTRKSRLSVVFKTLTEGASITMTTGTPVSVSFLTNLVQGQPITISAVDQNNAPTTPIGVTATSDNASVTVTPDATDPLTFWFQGVVGFPVTGNVTFTDSSGDTVVVTATTSDAVPPTTTTLIATPGTPV